MMRILNLGLLLITIAALGQQPSLTPIESAIDVTIIPHEEHQTISGFGASDAWSIQFVGQYWPESKRNQIADLLFSNQLDRNNNPIGIGLSQWRFNIGAGSRSQGEDSGIKDAWRRTESFLGDTGYNWNAQNGQLWFLNAAKKRGVNQFIAFSNSPPITMTKNSKAYSDGGIQANIDRSKYMEYINFLTRVLEEVNTRHQIEFDYIAPFNEPQWDWKRNSGQEGSPWTNSDIKILTTLLDSMLTVKHSTTKIELAEAGQLNYLYDTDNKAERGNQIQAFFNPQSQNYLGNLKRVAHKISGHSYYTTFDTNTLISTRSKLKNTLQTLASPPEFWMTEYCVLENNKEIVGRGRDLGIDTALYVGRVIHTDLVLADASAWQWWLAVSPYNYKDGLIYIDKNKNNGHVYESKLLWTLGHYSRFIKRGYKRIGLERSDQNTAKNNIKDVLISTYKAPTKDEYIAVFINQTTSPKAIKYNVLDKDGYAATIYQTSNSPNDNLSYKGTLTSNNSYQMPAKSIVTLVINQHI